MWRENDGFKRPFRGRNNCLDVGMSSSTVKPIAEFLPEASSSLLEGDGGTLKEKLTWRAGVGDRSRVQSDFLELEEWSWEVSAQVQSGIRNHAAIWHKELDINVC